MYSSPINRNLTQPKESGWDHSVLLAMEGDSLEEAVSPALDVACVLEARPTACLVLGGEILPRHGSSEATLSPSQTSMGLQLLSS